MIKENPYTVGENPYTVKEDLLTRYRRPDGDCDADERCT